MYFSPIYNKCFWCDSQKESKNNAVYIVWLSNSNHLLKWTPRKQISHMGNTSRDLPGQARFHLPLKRGKKLRTSGCMCWDGSCCKWWSTLDRSTYNSAMSNISAPPSEAAVGLMWRRDKFVLATNISDWVIGAFSVHILMDFPWSDAYDADRPSLKMVMHTYASSQGFGLV